MEKESDRAYKRHKEEQASYRERKEALQGGQESNPDEYAEEAPSDNENRTIDRTREGFWRRLFRPIG